MDHLVRLHREPRAHKENYEAEKFKEKDSTFGEASAGNSEETGQAETKAASSGSGKGGESQKEIGCPHCIEGAYIH